MQICIFIFYFWEIFLLFNIQPKCRFLPKLRKFTKTSYIYQNFDYLPVFRIFTKILEIYQNFRYLPNFRIFTKISVLWQKKFFRYGFFRIFITISNTSYIYLYVDDLSAIFRRWHFFIFFVLIYFLYFKFFHLYFFLFRFVFFFSDFYYFGGALFLISYSAKEKQKMA